MEDEIIPKEAVTSSVKRMKEFNDDLKSLSAKYEIDLTNNKGRRNAILSVAQETFLSKELGSFYYDVKTDGRPGQADIEIGDLNLEVECKLTSPRKSGGISMQCDYDTLALKGELDFLYYIVDGDFNKYSALHFEGLTTEDFYPPANGSRGKSRMNKDRAMRKVNVIHGKVTDLKVGILEDLRSKVEETTKKRDKRISEIEERIRKCNTSTKKYLSLCGTLEREKQRFQKKLSKLEAKIEKWRNSPSKFNIKLEGGI